jgi:hypothetical protein
MKSRVSSYHPAIVATLLLVVGIAVLIRLQNPVASTTDTPSTSNVGDDVPEFTSATFPDGDILKGLGPEWTYLRQSPLESNDARALPGLTPNREALVKLAGESTEMSLAIYDIADHAKLDAALATYSTSTVSSRSGWVIPLNDISGGSGFLLVGSRSALLISLSGSAEWPSTLPAPVTSFITAIRVP